MPAAGERFPSRWQCLLGTQLSRHDVHRITLLPGFSRIGLWFSTIKIQISALDSFFKNWVETHGYKIHYLKMNNSGTSLSVQWLRTCLPMQKTQVWSLVREDPTCHAATKAVSHSYWACAPEPGSYNYWAHEPQPLSLWAESLCFSTKEATAMRSPRTATREQTLHATRESLIAATKTQHSQKKINIKYIIQWHWRYW